VNSNDIILKSKNYNGRNPKKALSLYYYNLVSPLRHIQFQNMLKEKLKVLVYQIYFRLK